jgi:hypothetical protein
MNFTSRISFLRDLDYWAGLVKSPHRLEYLGLYLSGEEKREINHTVYLQNENQTGSKH